MIGLVSVLMLRRKDGDDDDNIEADDFDNLEEFEGLQDMTAVDKLDDSAGEIGAAEEIEAAEAAGTAEKDTTTTAVEPEASTLPFLETDFIRVFAKLRGEGKVIRISDLIKADARYQQSKISPRSLFLFGRQLHGSSTGDCGCDCDDSAAGFATCSSPFLSSSAECRRCKFKRSPKWNKRFR